MNQIVKAAAVQCSPVLYSQKETVQKICNTILELGKQGVQFAVFPETVVPYYPYFSFVQPPFAMGKEHLKLLNESVVVPSEATFAIGQACAEAKMVVSIGLMSARVEQSTTHSCYLMLMVQSFSIVEKLPQLIMNVWCGDKAMAVGCVRLILLSGVLDHWHAGSIITLWLGLL